MKIIKRNLRKLVRQGSGRSNGFSFVELIIVVAIIGIMTAVGLASLAKNRTSKQLEMEGRKVVSVIREAQNNALTGKKIGSGYPCSFSVVLRPEGDSTKYSREYFSKPTISDVCPGTSSELNKYTLDYGVFVSWPPVETGIKFYVPFGRSDWDQRITLSKGMESYNICVCKSGKILEKKSASCDLDSASETYDCK